MGMVLARHAEENALEKYKSSIGLHGRKEISLRKLTLCVIRINALGELTESKPCAHCAEVFRSFGIRKVAYSTRNGNILTISLNKLVTEPSVGYRSMETAINILDEMILDSKGSKCPKDFGD